MHTVFGPVNNRRQWWQVPTTSLKALNLLSLRLDLRDLNLHDNPGDEIKTEAVEDPPPQVLTARRADGRWNDLKDPDMGAVGTPFSRNIDPRKYKPETPPRLHDPSARKVSLELMTRHQFQPAET